MGKDIFENMVKIINECWENNEIEEIYPEIDLMEAGMDSITFIKMIVAIEENYEIEVPDEKLLMTEMNTIDKIIDVILSALENNKEVIL